MYTEAKIQGDFFKWAWNNYPQYRRLLFHIPNGGMRGIIEASRFKAIGVIPGVPDMFFSVPNKYYHGLYLEFKNDTGKPSKDQIEIHGLYRKAGYQVEIIDNQELAETVFKGYIATVDII